MAKDYIIHNYDELIRRCKELENQNEKLLNLLGGFINVSIGSDKQGKGMFIKPNE